MSFALPRLSSCHYFALYCRSLVLYFILDEEEEDNNPVGGTDPLDSVVEGLFGNKMKRMAPVAKPGASATLRAL